MEDLDELLSENGAHRETYRPLASGRPARGLSLLTCIDCRIEPSSVLGLSLGDAHVLRNGGARVTDDVVRGLVISCRLFGVDTLVVMEHTHCGLLAVTNDELRSRTGSSIDFFPIASHEAALRADIDALAANGDLWALRQISGVVYDLDTGEARELVRFERPGGPKRPGA